MAESFDIVVVGGGIHGVGIAQAAAAGGHRVLLPEKGRLAGGTSGGSSKLIHGGLRYLESGRLAMVGECLRERALLLKLAPDLVQLKPFHFPIYRTTRRRPWQVRTGLSLYALLGGFNGHTRFRRVPPNEWESLDGLRTDDLGVVFRYHDAQTDDAALTAAVMRSAQTLGAELAMPARFVGARLTGDGCAVDYQSNGAQRTCRARVMVNVAGAWAARVLERIDPAPPSRAVELVQGAHIVVEGRVDRGIYYVEVPSDGRAVFVMPWRESTLVGTTETPFDGDPDQVRPLDEEKAYLSSVLEHYFPRYRGTGKIVEAFAALRVLPSGPGRAFSRSRETILDVDRADRPRVLTVYGGKLTTYRSTAEKVMKRLAGALPARKPVADTRTLTLSPT